MGSTDLKETAKDAALSVDHTTTAAGNRDYTATAANTTDSGSAAATVDTDHSATTAAPVTADPLSFLEKLEPDGKC